MALTVTAISSRTGSTGGFDEEAASYIRAVQQADGLPLDPIYAYAVNNFVLGCKESGIWDAIKVSCIMAGARTLAGALVPLKGVAPTNFNFIQSDYNRRTGLTGNGSTKYLNCNRDGTAEPQLNISLGAWVTADNYPVGSSDRRGVIGNSDSAFYHQFVGRRSYRCRMGFNNAGNGPTTLLCGVARDNSSNYRLHSGSVNAQINQAANSYASGPTTCFRTLQPVNDPYSLATLSFYWVGEFLNMSLLYDRVNTLMTTIGTLPA